MQPVFFLLSCQFVHARMPEIKDAHIEERKPFAVECFGQMLGDALFHLLFEGNVGGELQQRAAPDEFLQAIVQLPFQEAFEFGQRIVLPALHHVFEKQRRIVHLRHQARIRL